LSECLAYTHVDSDGLPVKPIILIDDYDAALESAWANGYLPQMTELVRSFFDEGLKTNENLYFAVITGCLTMPQESFLNCMSGSALRGGFGEYFGFTQPEMDKLLGYYGLTGQGELIRDSYGGYRFGNSEAYNPWSVMHHINRLRRGREDAAEQNCLANSSSNDTVERLVDSSCSLSRADKESFQSAINPPILRAYKNGISFGKKGAALGLSIFKTQ